MQGSLDRLPIIIRGRRWRGGLTAALGLLIASPGLLPAGQNSSQAVSLVFGLLISGMGLWMAVAPSRLEITATGVRQTVLWRTSRYGWNEIYDFRPVQFGLRPTGVGFDFIDPTTKRAGLRQFNRSLVGVHGVLQSGWEIKAVALAALLNQAREQALNPAGAPGQAPAGDRTALPAAPGWPTPAGGIIGARIGRKRFLIMAGVLLTLTVGLSLLAGRKGGVSGGGSVLFIWIFTARLHDIGRSGWWQAPLYVAQVAVVLALMLAGHQTVEVAGGAAALLQIAFVIALGSQRGDPGANRFGPPPGQPTALAQSEVFR